MRKHIPFIIFYLTLLVTGICIHGDYGVSWDEGECRIDNGILNTNFIRTHDQKPLLESISKYHGAAFEMFLVKIEQAGQFKSTHDIFLMRHLITFFLFTVSALFFYLICLKMFRSGWYALAGCLFLVLSPRIFADSFYNTKDLPFLSFIIISFYTIILFLNNKSVRNAIICALVMGVMIDIRIMGILLPVFTFIYLLIDFIRHKDERKRIIQTSIIFSIILTGTIIFFWPVLWLGPVKHFLLAWKEMSMYPWEGSVLFNGNIYKAVNLPLNYLPVWILISTPPLYIAFFLIGVFIILKKIILKAGISIFESFSLFLFFIPLFSVLFLHSVVYDAWRHMFFIYPAIVLMSLTGLHSIMQLINKRFQKYLATFIAVYFASIIIAMANLHPFENIYFNSFVRPANIHDNYETDYWALSYKQGYEYILQNDSSENIIVYLGEGQPGTDNMLFLTREYSRRITITDVPELADYYLTCHRYDRLLKNYKNVHRITRNGIVIHSVYDLRSDKINLTTQNQVAEFNNNYEQIPDPFHPIKIIGESEGQQLNHFESVSASDGYAGNFNTHPPEQITAASPKKKYMIASAKLRSSEPFRTMFDFQVDSNTTYRWIYTTINNSFTDKWNSYKYICAIPDIYSVSDILKVHFQNDEGGNFQIDDFDIHFYALDTAIVTAALKNNPCK